MWSGFFKSAITTSNPAKQQTILETKNAKKELNDNKRGTSLEKKDYLQ
jgi:hypothetical protein